MWIKSQDKCTLINAKKFEIADFHTLYKNGIWGDDNLLGEYSTREKALKVLNMIQEQKTKNEAGIYNSKFGVYQMPQDDEI